MKLLDLTRYTKQKAGFEDADNILDNCEDTALLADDANIRERLETINILLDIADKVVMITEIADLAVEGAYEKGVEETLLNLKEQGYT